jgi:hypothetical protein
MRKRSMEDFGMSGSTPSFGPMSSTVSGSAIGPALTDLGGPLLGKSAAMQFELMDKKAQAEVLSNPEVPVMAKLSLAMRHTKLPVKARVKLAHHILSTVPTHEKQAIMGLLRGAGKMIGGVGKAIKPGFGNSAALQGQLRSLGGVSNVQHNLKSLGAWGKAGVPNAMLFARRGGHGLGHYPTFPMPQQSFNFRGGAGASGAARGGSAASSAAGAATPPSVPRLGPASPSSAPKATGPSPMPSSPKTTGPMDETVDFDGPMRPGVKDPHSIFPADPRFLDEADEASKALSARANAATAASANWTPRYDPLQSPTFGRSNRPYNQ